ncbi:MAG: efflux RND transporter permease subunit [Myxococcales bacterium]|nr:MAG: efflux RND transporter permease subunit [Myxococcales bacterium]
MSTFFIDRPIFANVIAIVTVIVGLVCLYRLPVAQYPEIVPPTIQVTTVYPGASATVVADTVGVPIEQAVNGVEGALYMSSTSASDGSYTLTVTFAVGTDLNTALSLVQNYVNSAYAALPAVVQFQGVSVRKVSTNILMVVSLYGEDLHLDETYLSNYAIINLRNPLARLPGVGQVSVVGAGAYSMRVWLDPHRLQHHGITTLDVQNAIRQQNRQAITGQLGGPPTDDEQVFQLTINTLGRLSEVEQFENIIVKTTQGAAPRIVRVKDIARVELSQRTYSNFSTLGRREAAHIAVYSLPGANALDVSDHVREAMAEMSDTFPPSVAYAIRYDTTRFVKEAIDDVFLTLLEAGVLVLIVILLFLQNLRAMLVPATTVPVTIIGAFAAMAVLGFSVNLMTLFALILAIAIVVDDAIVIVENASRYVEKGLSPRDATIQAMDELTGPVIGITLVLTAVFLPAAFLPGIAGQLFRQFALVIASTAVISAINALTLKPAQCALYLRSQGEKRENRLYRGFNVVYGLLEDAYIRVVQWMVGRPRSMAVLFFAIIGVAAWQFVELPTGFLPAEDQGYAIVAVRLPDAAAQPRVRAVAKQIDAILDRSAGVQDWLTIGGFSVLDGANVSSSLTTFVVYDDWSVRGSSLTQEEIIGTLQTELAAIQEASIFVIAPSPIPGLGQSGGFQMMVEDRASRGLASLEQSTHELVHVARTQTGVQGLATTFSASSPQLYLDIDRTKVESLGIVLGDVFATLQGYLGSAYVNLFNKYNQVFQVYVQADASHRREQTDIESLYVRNGQGEMVPLGTLLDVRRTVGAELVSRYNLYPAAAVYGRAAPGFSSGQALSLMDQVAADTLPEGIAHDWTATAYQESRVGNQPYFIYALSIVLVYLVLAAQYESWFSPAAVILVVPMALVGVLLALLARGYDNNLYTQVGLVLMIALASKNAILVVEFARDLQTEGRSVTEAAVEATRRRFRPIVMTSFAFILGVVPLLSASGAGAASQRALGTVVFGGMLSSTLLAIPFVPVFYVLTEQLAARIARRSPT